MNRCKIQHKALNTKDNGMQIHHGKTDTPEVQGAMMPISLGWLHQRRAGSGGDFWHWIFNAKEEK